jgi:nucleosome assembly protein 1-like 1
VLKYLSKLEYLPAGDKTDNFTIRFTFEMNEFFTNTILTKSFYLKDGENPVRSDGTIIEWKEGKNVTKKTVKKKQKNKKNGKQRVIATEMDADSFFNFFRHINLEEKEAIEKQLDQEEKDRIAERMDIDYDMARMIIDEIIPYSLEYYLGIKINDNYDDIADLDDKSDQSEDEEYEEEKRKEKKKEDKIDRQECK